MNPHNTDVHSIRYSDEVKREAVARLRNGESYKAVAASIGCHTSNLSIWKRNVEGTAPVKRAHGCPHCSDLIAALRLVLASADGSHALRASVNQIAEQAIARATHSDKEAAL